MNKIINDIIQIIKDKYPNSDIYVEYYKEKDEYFINPTNEEFKDNEEFNDFLYSIYEEYLWKNNIYNIFINYMDKKFIDNNKLI